MFEKWMVGLGLVVVAAGTGVGAGMAIASPTTVPQIIDGGPVTQTVAATGQVQGWSLTGGYQLLPQVKAIIRTTAPYSLLVVHFSGDFGCSGGAGTGSDACTVTVQDNRTPLPPQQTSHVGMGYDSGTGALVPDSIQRFQVVEPGKHVLRIQAYSAPSPVPPVELRAGDWQITAEASPTSTP